MKRNQIASEDNFQNLNKHPISLLYFFFFFFFFLVGNFQNLKKHRISLFVLKSSYAGMNTTPD